MEKRQKIFLSWFWVGLCTLSIFLIVPLARTIQNFVSTHWSRSVFGYSVLFTACGVFFILLYILYFRLKIRAVANYIWLTLIAGTYIYFTISLWEAPEEAVHFLEYGLLGFFLFRALRLRINNKSIYVVAFLIGSLVGIFDEIIQWTVPARYWDIRDVGLNALSSGLFQVALWKGINPKLISQRIPAKSIKAVSILFAANIILLGFCLSNTPQRVKSYTKLFPALSFLQKEETMNAFRNRHEDPEIGIFYSRLTLEEIEKIDKENTEENGQILREWKDKDYDEFLRHFPGLSFPFLHELRVHIFRRDKRLEKADLAKDRETKKKNYFIAYKENLILEKYFGHTLQDSSYKWDREKTEHTKVFINLNAPYKSPVSATLFSFSEKAMWIAIIALLIILVLIKFFSSRTQKLQ